MLNESDVVLLNGDSADIATILPPGSIDAIVTDPPAGIGFMGREWDGDKGGQKHPNGFGAWLAGLIDGEGNFDIHRQKRESGEYFYCRFEMTLRADDGGVLQMLQRELGGKVYYGESSTENGSPRGRWELVARKECLALVDLLDGCPLQTKKARDYVIWREALAVSCAHEGTSRPDLMLPFWEALRATRPYAGKVTDSSTFREMSHDHAWIAWLAKTLAPAFAALKPGGHALVWAIPRTSHWTAMALELAGFEIRDVVHHLFGTGFPKSLTPASAPIPEGTGTALKPAAEHWILARKPLAGTVAANVAEHGTGVLNIDACRIGTDDEWAPSTRGANDSIGTFKTGERTTEQHELGRWPAHVTLDEEAARLAEWGRFFYVAKPNGKERDAGCDDLPVKSGGEATGRDDESAGVRNPRAGAGRGGGRRNHHPTVKSIGLMRWLVRLITPPGGTVLDMFAGSGSTGVAAIAEGFAFVGCEREPEYAEIARARLTHALKEREGCK